MASVVSGIMSLEKEHIQAVITRILVPLDLHRLSEAKVPVAAAQARAFGAELILLHVCPPTRAPGKKTTFAEARARTYLDALVARLRADGIEAQPVVRWGRPAEAILAEIAE